MLERFPSFSGLVSTLIPSSFRRAFCFLCWLFLFSFWEFISCFPFYGLISWSFRDIPSLVGLAYLCSFIGEMFSIFSFCIFFGDLTGDLVGLLVGLPFFMLIKATYSLHWVIWLCSLWTSSKNWSRTYLLASPFSELAMSCGSCFLCSINNSLKLFIFSSIESQSSPYFLYYCFFDGDFPPEVGPSFASFLGWICVSLKANVSPLPNDLTGLVDSSSSLKFASAETKLPI